MTWQAIRARGGYDVSILGVCIICRPSSGENRRMLAPHGAGADVMASRREPLYRGLRHGSLTLDRFTGRLECWAAGPPHRSDTVNAVDGRRTPWNVELVTATDVNETATTSPAVALSMPATCASALGWSRAPVRSRPDPAGRCVAPGATFPEQGQYRLIEQLCSPPLECCSAPRTTGRARAVKAELPGAFGVNPEVTFHAETRSLRDMHVSACPISSAG